MKYRLKNQDLQQRLEAFLGKEFVEEALIKGDVDNYILTIYADLGDGAYVDVGIHIDDLEEIEEYDPDEWNNFPAVTPPENVWMRCECYGDEKTYRCVAKYAFFGDSNDFHWFDSNNEIVDVDRFRPWDE